MSFFETFEAVASVQQGFSQVLKPGTIVLKTRWPSGLGVWLFIPAPAEIQEKGISGPKHAAEKPAERGLRFHRVRKTHALYQGTTFSRAVQNAPDEGFSH
jgi:hypothetical protein